MKIWRCPSCTNGIRAPKTMYRDDIRRFCLPCSQEKGILVRRVTVTTISRREDRQKANEARKAQLAQEQHLYPWCIKEDFAKITKAICWTQRAKIKSLGLTILHSKRRHAADVTFSKGTITLEAGQDKAHAYALLLWQLALIDTGAAPAADRRDVFLTAASAFLGQGLLASSTQEAWSTVLTHLIKYTDEMEVSSITSVKVSKRKSKPKESKTRLGSSISRRERKAVW